MKSRTSLNALLDIAKTRGADLETLIPYLQEQADFKDRHDDSYSYGELFELAVMKKEKFDAIKRAEGMIKDRKLDLWAITDDQYLSLRNQIAFVLEIQSKYYESTIIETTRPYTRIGSKIWYKITMKHHTHTRIIKGCILINGKITDSSDKTFYNYKKSI